MQIIKVTIHADAVLSDAISDYLIGVLDAAVEYSVDDDRTGALHAFIIAESWLVEERKALEAAITAFAEEMAAIFTVAKPIIESEVIADQDWAKNWKEYFKPFEILEGLVIAPSWQPYEVQAGEAVIVMDPGMAFGTGHHATTRLCLQLISMEKECFCNGGVLDVGTGTGILGMAAALWGAADVLGIDNDAEAVAAARYNVLRNGLQNRVSISERALAEVLERYPLVVANIVHDVLIELAEDLQRVTSPGGLLIVSGLIYGDQTSNISDCFCERGFGLLSDRQEQEWGALMLKKL